MSFVKKQEASKKMSFKFNKIISGKFSSNNPLYQLYDQTNILSHINKHIQIKKLLSKNTETNQEKPDPYSFDDPEGKKLLRKDSLQKLKENKKYEKNIDHEFFTPIYSLLIKESKNKKIKLNTKFIVEDFDDEIKDSLCFLTEPGQLNINLIGNQKLIAELKSVGANKKERKNIFTYAQVETFDSQNINKQEEKLKDNKQMVKATEKDDYIKTFSLNKKKKQKENLYDFLSLKTPYQKADSKNLNLKQNLSSNQISLFSDDNPSFTNSKEKEALSDLIKNIRNSTLNVIRRTSKKLTSIPIGDLFTRSNNKNKTERLSNLVHLPNIEQSNNNTINSSSPSNAQKKHKDKIKIKDKESRIRENNISLYKLLYNKMKLLLEEKLFRLIKEGKIKEIFDNDKPYFIKNLGIDQYIPIIDYQQEFLFFSFLTENICRILIDKYDTERFRNFFLSSFECIERETAYENYFEKEEFTIYLITLSSLLEDTDGSAYLLNDYLSKKSFNSMFFIDAFLFKNFILTRRVMDKSNLFIDLFLTGIGIDMRLSLNNYYDYKIYYDKCYITLHPKQKLRYLSKSFNLINITQKFYYENIHDLIKAFSISKNYYVLIKEFDMNDFKLLSTKKISEIERIYDKVINYIRG